jgi:hypothetical protein
MKNINISTESMRITQPVIVDDFGLSVVNTEIFDSNFHCLCGNYARFLGYIKDDGIPGLLRYKYYTCERCLCDIKNEQNPLLKKRMELNHSLNYVNYNKNNNQ